MPSVAMYATFRGPQFTYVLNSFLTSVIIYINNVTNDFKANYNRLIGIYFRG